MSYSKNNISFYAILLIATIVLATSTLLTYKNSVKASQDALKFQAIGIGASLESSLKGNNLQKTDIFREIITEGKWEGIAFLALYDEDTKIVLHSNKNLIGRRTDDLNIKKLIETNDTSYSYLTLGTGERVFVLDMPISINKKDYVLRISLHTYYADEIIRYAKMHAFAMIFIIIAIWFTGYFFIRASKRADELRLRIQERERFAVLGEMASVLAHEIRNPLGSIKGFAQYLKEQIKDKKAYKESLDIIISESHRLEALTNDLLLYARPSELRIEDFDLLDVVKESINSFNDINDIKILTSIPHNIKITSDRDKIKQILINLIQNAIDADSSVINIDAEAEKRYCVLYIKDNGCGMGKDILENVYKPFFTTKTRGTGLGLTIVDKLIRSIGAEIELKSEPQKGTVFKITLPKSI